jgi:hypothetical protein
VPNTNISDGPSAVVFKGPSAFKNQIDMTVDAKSYLHSKLTEFFFLLRFECALDCSEIELVTHFVELRVGKRLSIARSRPA